jgi:hypothetical protein
MLHGSPMSLSELTKTDLTRPFTVEKTKWSLSPLVMRLYSLICEWQCSNYFLFNFKIHIDVQSENPVINETQLQCCDSTFQKLFPIYIYVPHCSNKSTN